MQNEQPKDVKAEGGELDLSRFEGHTPGPWSYNGLVIETAYPDFRSNRRQQRCAIAETVNGYEPDEREANGRLMAAAPELLAEVKRLRKQRDELVKELEKIVNVEANRMPDTATWREIADDCITIARRAVDTAKGLGR